MRKSPIGRRRHRRRRTLTLETRSLDRSSCRSRSSSLRPRCTAIERCSRRSYPCPFIFLLLPSGRAHFKGFSASQSRIPGVSARPGAETESHLLELSVLDVDAERLSLESLELSRHLVVAVGKLAQGQRRAALELTVDLHRHTRRLREHTQRIHHLRQLDVHLIVRVGVELCRLSVRAVALLADLEVVAARVEIGD